MIGLQRLINDFRVRADDAATPPLWSDATLALYANEAQIEAAQRARLIDDRSSVITQVAVTAGTAVYGLDSRIILLRRVKLASQTAPLPKIDERDLDAIDGNWENGADAPPAVWLPWGSNQARLYPGPDANDTMSLWVVREPLRRMRLAQAALAISSLTFSGGIATATIAADATLEAGDVLTISGATQTEYNGVVTPTIVSPTSFTYPVTGAPASPATGAPTYAVAAIDSELAPRYAVKLVDWMMYRALDERDKEEKFDADGANRHLAEFEAVFGKRSSAIDETWIARKHGMDPLEGLF